MCVAKLPCDVLFVEFRFRFSCCDLATSFFQCVDGCVCLLMGKQFMCFLNICECVVVCFSMPLGYVFGCYDACKCMQMSKLAIHIDV